ncbi:MAG: hypothetical protein HZA46_24320 [Planctomycetales bacterium]|nr:hypothetical protein [Planctomycetales bacterium]
MKTAQLNATTVDQARTELCRHLARLMVAGSHNFRIRTFLSDGEPVRGCLYTYRNHAWRKVEDVDLSQSIVEVLDEQLDMLVSRAHADAWSARQKNFADRRDVDIRFHRDAIDPHLNGNLASFLLGSLFLGHHDSRKDVRRQMRWRSR